MTLVIQGVSIEGVRGFNKRVELPLCNGLNLIHGPNGAGKSSVLQSIEWCLTGKLSHLQGTDFKREDAIVNPFHHDKSATVTVTLNESGNPIEVTRKRRMGKSTTTGKSKLTVTRGGEVWHDEEAEEKLASLFGLRIDEISRTLHLHQEALRELISEDPEERSVAIDKLLGLEELREFSEALDARRKVSLAVKRIGEEIEVLKRDKVQFAVAMRKRLEEQRQRLESSGHSPGSLGSEELGKELRQLHTDASALSSKMGVSFPSVSDGGSTVKDLELATSEIEGGIKSLDRQRIGTVQAAQRRSMSLEHEKDQLSATMDALSRQGSSLSELSAKRESTEREEQALAESIRRVKELRQVLGPLDLRKSAIEQELHDARRKVTEIEGTHGDERQQLTLEAELGTTLKDLQQKQSEFAKYEQLLTIAHDYLSEAHPKDCPVCTRMIDYKALMITLKAKAESDAGKSLVDLREKEILAKNKQKDLRSAIDSYKTARSRVEELTRALVEIGVKATSLTGDKIKSPDELGKIIGNIDAQMAESSSLRDSKLEELRELKERELLVSKLIREIDSGVARLRSILGTGSVGEPLIKEAASELEKLKETIETFQSTKDLDELTSRLAGLKEVYEYLKSEEEVKGIEEQIPSISELIADLEERQEKLNQLDGSLAAIQLVAIQYAKEAVANVINSLEDSLNSYFGQLEGHPYYAKLTLQIEKEHPLIYSVRASSGEESTYVSTRFSTAQLNVASIAMFLSNYEKTAPNLGCVLMDDPTQSMDPRRIAALAKVVGRLAQQNQIIVATDDDDLKEKMSKECPEAKIYELRGWDTEGPKFAAADSQ